MSPARSALSVWFPYNKKPDPQAPARLFCFPHAGAGASTFRPWMKAMGAPLEVWPAQPPAHESRFVEPACRDVPALAASAVAALLPVLDRPCALFGHSLGALVAFEVARQLEAAGRPVEALFVSAHTAPHLPPVETIGQLSDAAFVARLKALNGMPDEVLAHKELLELVLPTLREDIRIAEAYRVPAQTRLRTPLRVFGGAEDQTCPASALSAWGELSTRFLGERVFPGDHFYLRPQEAAVLAAIRDEVAALRATTRGPG